MAAAPLTESTARRRVFVAAFLGWLLDGYDFTILTLVLVDIGQDLQVDRVGLGALGTATLLARLVGGVVAGAAADRWGRKLPLMVSIAWFSLFSFLSGLAPTYSLLFICRLLFGFGMGGEWAAGMPLVLEHWSHRSAGLVLGVLQGAFSWGFILAALVYELLMPQLAGGSIPAWRLLLMTGVAPALLVLWIRAAVPESPTWQASSTQTRRVMSWSAFARREVIVAALCLTCCMLAYQSMSYWYATLLRERGLSTLPFLTALNVGGIIGAAFWGRVGDLAGPARALGIGAGLAAITTPWFVAASTPWQLMCAAGAIGLTGAGVIGLAPTYIGRLFPDSVRATGWGVIYHVAAASGAFAPIVIGLVQDTGYTLAVAMGIGTAVPALSASVLALASSRRAAGSASAEEQRAKRR